MFWVTGVPCVCVFGGFFLCDVKYYIVRVYFTSLSVSMLSCDNLNEEARIAPIRV